MCVLDTNWDPLCIQNQAYCCLESDACCCNDKTEGMQKIVYKCYPDLIPSATTAVIPLLDLSSHFPP